MIKLSPSILAADFSRLGEEVRAVEEGGADFLHIDVMDGHFVPSISFGTPIVKSLRPVSSLFFDVHLMVTDPLRHVDAYAGAGADLIDFQMESAPDVRAVLERIHAHGKKSGIAIRPATPVEAAAPYLEDMDLLLVMTVEPGEGGQAIIPSCIDKIREARKLIDASGRNIFLEIDGGVRLGNVEIPLEAGADVIVSGSAIFRGDIAGNVRAFRERFHRFEAEK